MKTQNIPELRQELRSFLEGYARVAPLSVLSGTNWAKVAAAERERRAAQLLDAMSESLRAAIVNGAINVTNELREAQGTGATTGAATPSANELTDGVPRSIECMRAAVVKLAGQHFGFTTLETRNSDSLDFREVAVWSAREALSAAFLAGYEAGTT